MKISVCIPAYERPQLLSRAISSVLVQSFQDFEILISDDSVSSAVSEMIETEFPSDTRIKYVKNLFPLGSPRNWNKSIEMSSGEIIKILHHDDFFISEHALQQIVEEFDANAGVAFVACSSKTYDPKGNPWGFTILDDALFKRIRKDPLCLFQGNLIGAPSAIAYRRTLKIQFDERMKWLVDLDFYLAALLAVGAFAFIKQPLVGISILDPSRVTAESEKNGYVELLEYLIFYYKVVDRFGIRLRPFLHIWMIFDRYDVKTVEDLVLFDIPLAYVHPSIKTLLLFKAIYYKFLMATQVFYKLVSPSSLLRLALTRIAFLYTFVRHRPWRPTRIRNKVF